MVKENPPYSLYDVADDDDDDKVNSSDPMELVSARATASPWEKLGSVLRGQGFCNHGRLYRPHEHKRAKILSSRHRLNRNNRPPESPQARSTTTIETEGTSPRRVCVGTDFIDPPHCVQSIPSSVPVTRESAYRVPSETERVTQPCDPISTDRNAEQVLGIQFGDQKEQVKAPEKMTTNVSSPAEGAKQLYSREDDDSQHRCEAVERMASLEESKVDHQPSMLETVQQQRAISGPSVSEVFHGKQDHRLGRHEGLDKERGYTKTEAVAVTSLLSFEDSGEDWKPAMCSLLVALMTMALLTASVAEAIYEKNTANSAPYEIHTFPRAVLVGKQFDSVFVLEVSAVESSGTVGVDNRIDGGIYMLSPTLRRISLSTNNVCREASPASPKWNDFYCPWDAVHEHTSLSIERCLSGDRDDNY